MTDSVFIICIAAIFALVIICDHREKMAARRRDREEPRAE
jgi:hypothetical protein